MVNGLTNGSSRRHAFWPIFERAQALDVPIYLHPQFPHPDVIEATTRFTSRSIRILRAGWGFTVETATRGIRLVLSGVFDAYRASRSSWGHWRRLPSTCGASPRLRGSDGGKSFATSSASTSTYISGSSPIGAAVRVMEMGSTASCSRSITLRRQSSGDRNGRKPCRYARGQGEAVERQCRRLLKLE